MHFEWSSTVPITPFTQPSGDSVWKQYVNVMVQLILLLPLLNKISQFQTNTPFDFN